MSRLEAGSRFWDRAGISLSGVCILHCLLLPVLLAALPMWGAGETMHAWLHPVFAVVLVPTTVLAAIPGYQNHRSAFVLGVLALGLLVILVAGVVGHRNPGAGADLATTLVGSVLLISGHVMNWRLGTRSASCQSV